MLTDRELAQLLRDIQKPGRYIGGETNAVRKEFGSADFHMALVFPDTYEIGMSHLGLQILYGLVNARPDSLAERAFMPWFDMEARLRGAGVELFSLESRRPLRDFDVIGFSLQYELCYATVLKMLDMAGIPRRRSQRRGADYPLVIAGGPCTLNPEPLVDFFDLFFIGDGEEALGEFIEVWKEHKNGGPAAVVAETARRVGGVYAPELYRCVDGAVVPEAPGVPEVVEAACVRDLENAFFPTAPVIPAVQAVHDRISLEVMRGCPRGCRFCQAGMTRKPVRLRSVRRLLELAEKSYRSTGYDEISLLGLSTGDYPFLGELADRLTHRFAPLRVGLAFPSLRADRALELIPQAASRVRKSAITVAVEAATEQLRTVINKGITEEGLLAGLTNAFAAGYNRVKLYFMAGLPTETLEDIKAVVSLINRIIAAAGQLGRSVQINCSIAPFIPKPGTPFQWEGMRERAYLEEARGLLQAGLRGRPVKISFHDVDRSFLEAALARGGREVGAVLEKAADAGCFLDAWDEGFDFGRWREAFDAAGIDLESYARRRLSPGEGLAWGHISAGVAPEYLERERVLAFEAVEALRRGPSGSDGR